MKHPSLEFVKAIFFPAVVALSLFLSINYLVRPAIRRYKEQYEQYLPLHQISGTLAQRTKSLKDRIGDKIMGYILPDFDVDREGIMDCDEDVADDEGEHMIGFDFRDIDRRREQLRREVGDMEDARRSTDDYGEPLPR